MVEKLRSGAGGHREIPLHCQLVAIEVGFQDLRLVILSK
jgi:hypothetical protein